MFCFNKQKNCDGREGGDVNLALFVGACVHQELMVGQAPGMYAGVLLRLFTSLLRHGPPTNRWPDGIVCG